LTSIQESVSKIIKSIGPGSLVAAAFIGPGTITVCSLAGFNFQFSLLWALIFSILATIILQEMCARLGIVTQKGLGQTLREEIQKGLFRILIAVLVVSAIFIGNSAYEGGNISGAVLGLETVTGPLAVFGLNAWNLLIGGIAAMVLLIGSYKVIEKTMIFLVLLMSLVFVITAATTSPNLLSLLKGMAIPKIPDSSTFLIMGLIGTTVVPYNFFLHSSSVSQKWKDKKDLKYARLDTVIAVAVGGVISIAIVISAASMFGISRDFQSAADLAVQLEPVLGAWSKYFLSVGLFAAGISSTITAPLATAFAVCGILGWSSNPRNSRFKAVALLVVLTGIVFSSVGFNPLAIIQFAQFANGLLLPVLGLFLVWVMNRSQLLGEYRNTMLHNIAGGLVILVTVFLGVKSILNVVGVL